MIYSAMHLSRIFVALAVTKAQMNFDPAYDIMVAEAYQTCTYDEGKLAGCAPNANCYIINNTPTCHCVVDVATGLPMAGNPYRGCTWDLSGTWEVRTPPPSVLAGADAVAAGPTPIRDPLTNQAIRFRILRTDAVLKTSYMTGSMFRIEGLDGQSDAYSVSRALLDVDDNETFMMVLSEGFLDNYETQMLLRNQYGDIGMSKKYGNYKGKKTKYTPMGHWQRSDGSGVKVYNWKKIPDVYRGSDYAEPMHSHSKKKRKLGPKTQSAMPNRPPKPFPRFLQHCYWFNAEAMGVPLLRLSSTLCVDETLPVEQLAYQTSARFVQLGFIGRAEFGSQRIVFHSPADGKVVFQLARVDQEQVLSPNDGSESSVTMSYDDMKRMVDDHESQNDQTRRRLYELNDVVPSDVLSGMSCDKLQAKFKLSHEFCQIDNIEAIKKATRRLDSIDEIMARAQLMRSADLSRGITRPVSREQVFEGDSFESTRPMGMDESYENNPHFYAWQRSQTRLNAVEIESDKMFRGLFSVLK
eukprot:GHVH01000355.1.p1 GENE.GHVH01000355.1~~GHVH01000355.1.p1  ORF type:complete len:524 (+),score=45.19 GHVH01000355.1:2485-4056(+)